MDELLRKRFLFVAGKGGVGRTTVSVALALAAAAEGRRVLLAGAPGKDRIGKLLGLGHALGTERVTAASGLDALHLDASAALAEYGRLVLRSAALYRALFQNPLVASFLRGTPGLDAWAVLGKAAWHALDEEGEDDGGDPAGAGAAGSPSPGSRSRRALRYDLVILDGPATGHALDMLRVPRVIQDASPPGLLRREAERAWGLLTDPDQAGVVLVTLPEDMPVDETIELHLALQELELPVPRLVVNRVWPRLFPPDARSRLIALPDALPPDAGALRALAEAGRRRAARESAQAEALARLDEALPDLPRTDLPHLFLPHFGREAVASLAAAFR